MRPLFLTLLNSKGPGALGFLPIRCILLLGNITLKRDLEQNWTFKSILSTVLKFLWVPSPGIFTGTQMTGEEPVSGSSVTWLMLIRVGSGSHTWDLLTPELDCLATGTFESFHHKNPYIPQP